MNEKYLTTFKPISVALLMVLNLFVSAYVFVDEQNKPNAPKNEACCSATLGNKDPDNSDNSLSNTVLNGLNNKPYKITNNKTNPIVVPIMPIQDPSKVSKKITLTHLISNLFKDWTVFDYSASNFLKTKILFLPKYKDFDDIHLIESKEILTYIVNNINKKLNVRISVVFYDVDKQIYFTSLNK